MKAKCHNMEKKDAVFSNEHLCGGKIIESFIPTCEEDGFTILQRKRGIRLIFVGLEPKLDWFPVPYLWVFATDEKGGSFAHGEGRLENSPIYYVSEENTCWYLAKKFSGICQAGDFAPEWMEKATGKKADFSEETKEERAKMGMVFGLEPPKTDLLAVVKEAEEIRIFASQAEAEAEYELL